MSQYFFRSSCSLIAIIENTDLNNEFIIVNHLENARWIDKTKDDNKH